MIQINVMSHQMKKSKSTVRCSYIEDGRFVAYYDGQNAGY